MNSEKVNTKKINPNFLEIICTPNKVKLSNIILRSASNVIKRQNAFHKTVLVNIIESKLKIFF